MDTVELESDCDRQDGVTYVRATIENTRRTPQIVRLESKIEGPVWAPGRGLVGSPRWDGQVWEGTINPGRIRGMGFASPAEPPAVPALDPVELIDTERVSPEEAPAPREVDASLEGWTPPSEAFFSDR